MQEEVETTGAEAPARNEDEQEREETPWTTGEWPPGL